MALAKRKHGRNAACIVAWMPFAQEGQDETLSVAIGARGEGSDTDITDAGGAEQIPEGVA
ncbi:hypothetical protein EZH22_23255 [Xanthobacter dioxanivorans]|uniref:Uncharacterized protein n=1 Tax=Xanthobacter dioxanivorans TaxID=2528964 RepID=A0A974PLQ8_9HYPH|nr:hypothetical protein EZH22_23255 [Xanthobacter dioxanivorans]